MSQHDPQIHPVDKLLQERITAKLKAEASPCPDPLWENLQQQINQGEKTTETRSNRQLFKLLPIAAGLLLVMGLYLWQRGATPVQALEITVDVAKDVQQVSTRGSRQEIQEHLAEQGFQVQIGDIEAYNSSHGHYVQLIGVNPVEVDGKPSPCLQLSFKCCGRPVSSYIVKQTDQKQQVTFKPTQADVKQNDQLDSNYRIVTFSSHPPEAVASLLTGSGE